MKVANALGVGLMLVRVMGVMGKNVRSVRFAKEWLAKVKLKKSARASV